MSSPDVDPGSFGSPGQFLPTEYPDDAAYINTSLICTVGLLSRLRSAVLTTIALHCTEHHGTTFLVMNTVIVKNGIFLHFCSYFLVVVRCRGLNSIFHSGNDRRQSTETLL